MKIEEAKRIVRLEDALEFCKKQSMLEQVVSNEDWKHYSVATNAIEKQISKKPVFDKDGCLVCGNCGSYFGIRTETNFIEGYCWECGQKIDTDHPTEKGGEQE